MEELLSSIKRKDFVSKQDLIEMRQLKNSEIKELTSKLGKGHKKELINSLEEVFNLPEDFKIKLNKKSSTKKREVKVEEKKEELTSKKNLV